jgi:hypothetical protein
MAEEEMVNVGESHPRAEAEEETVAKTTTTKKVKRKRKTKKRKTAGLVSDTVGKKGRRSERTVSVDTLLAVFLIISVVSNFYLFWQNSNLRGDVKDLEQRILNAPKGMGREPTRITDTTLAASGRGGAGEGKVNIIVLNDRRCVECDTTVLESRLEQVFPNAVIVRLDYSSAEGKRVYAESGLQFLPAVLFDETIEGSSGYSEVQNYLIKAGEYQSLRIGATFDPAAEICDNEKDDTGNGRVDCDDPTCTGKLVCREDIPEKLDVFVMSMCPYGTRALDAMEEVLENFPDIDFDVHFIASYIESSDSFSALHGQPEVDENIRELCAIKHYPEDYKYMEYIWCRDENIQDTKWERCATENGMDAEVIKKCFEGEEGKNLLIEDIKIANELGIGASPTWLANNRYTFGGITAESVKTSYCMHNEGLAGCENTLSGQADVPAAGAC